MEYTDFSNEQLRDRIEELELLLGELLKEKEQEVRLEYAWTGNLGHWYWNIKTNAVTFNPIKVTTLGYQKSEIPEHVTYQYFTDMLHPDDLKRTMDAMRDHLYGKADVYEAEYRIKAKDGNYRWFYDRGRITQFDEKDKPLFMAGIVFDVTEKRETQMELEYKNKILSELSLVDGLTNISNHKALIDHLNARIAEANRTNSPLSIAMFDIDDFKKVNDSKGHVYGDQVLIDVAAIIKDTIRDTDLAGRYGGEEFMIVFMNADLDTASSIAERVRESIEQQKFPEGITMTISGGVKQYGGENLSDFVNEADKKLYEAKRNGKNQIIS